MKERRWKAAVRATVRGSGVGVRAPSRAKSVEVALSAPLPLSRMQLELCVVARESPPLFSSLNVILLPREIDPCSPSSPSFGSLLPLHGSEANSIACYASTTASLRARRILSAAELPLAHSSCLLSHLDRSRSAISPSCHHAARRLSRYRKCEGISFKLCYGLSPTWESRFCVMLSFRSLGTPGSPPRTRPATGSSFRYFTCIRTSASDT